MNLLTETLERLAEHGKSSAEVQWVGAKAFGWCTWEEFAHVADVEYDDGYGSQEVASDLLVVGDGWWLTREDYDGSEWWRFNAPPSRPEGHRIPHSVTGGMWDTLEEIHGALAEETV